MKFGHGGRYRLRELLYCAGAIILLIGITAIVTLLGTNSGEDASAFERRLDPKQDVLFAVGQIYGIDIPARTVSVMWLVGGCGKFMLPPQREFQGSGPCGVPSVPLDIYVDGVLESSYEPEDLHPVDGNNVTYFVQNQVEFAKDHILDIQIAYLSGPGTVFDQAFWYPFDFYHLATSFFAINKNDNTSIPFTRLAFADSVDNFRPGTIEVETQTPFNGTMVPSRTSTLHLSRTTNAKLYVLVLFIVNWALTLLVAYITLLSALGEEFGEGIIVLPLTIILTLPTIRGLFVQEPPFGIFLDTLGLVLQMIIVSLCSIVILMQNVAKTRGPSFKS